MVSKKILLLMMALQLLFFFSTVSGEQGVPGSLELVYGQGLKQVFLPFEYKHLSSVERARTIWVPERFYTVIEQGSDKLALAGPLRPCLFVAIKNAANGRIVVFHKHFSNSMVSLIEIAQRELDIRNPRDISVIIFTNCAHPIMLERFREAHNGRPIQDEVKLVKDFIINQFEIPERTQIRAHIFTSRLPDFALGEYYGAELSVIIGSDFRPYSVCMMHENIFDEMRAGLFMGLRINCLPIDRKIDLFQLILQSKTTQLKITRFKDIVRDENGFYDYGTLPCLRIDL